MPGAAPFVIVMNAGSGLERVAAARAAIEGVLDAAGRRHRVYLVEKGAHLPRVAARAVDEARATGAVVVAAGGDGSINGVTQAVLGSGCTLGVVPLGTFNYFARNHAIPLDAAEAARLLLEGRAQGVQVGLVNERVFLVNASLGLYPQVLEDREAWKQHYGRRRLVALWAGLATLFAGHRALRLRIERGGASREVRTPTLFVGNNRLQLERIGIEEAPALDEGQLAGIVVRPVGTASMLWLALRGAAGQLGEAKNVDSFRFVRMTVRPPRQRRIKIATDGELAWLRPPLEFKVAPEPLSLIKPP